MQHPSLYLLIYGHVGGATRRVNRQVAQAMGDVVTVLFALMRGCARSGNIDLPRIEAGIPQPLRDQFRDWRDTDAGISDLADGELAACMFSYSRLHGAIALELAGHVPPQLADRDALFDLQMRHAAESLHRPAGQLASKT